MRHRDLPTASPLRRILGRLVVAGIAASTAVASVSATPTAASPATAAVPSQAPKGPSTTDDLVLVQANILTDLSVARFQADVREVLSLAPDFVTYNEASFRNDVVMAPPPGYAIHRDMTNRFTSAAPVAWRTDRWSAVDQGTFQISNWRGKPPGRETELGRRHVNWVTLLGTDGRVVSVVSAHVAPVVRGMPDLLKRSVARLTGLVDQLAASGPVLVGGDFNVHYTSGRYPRSMFEAHAMVPTFDTLGTYFATGDHGGHTIDYVFNRGVNLLQATSHRPVELNSDHDAVVAGFSWTTDVAADTRLVVSDPTGTQAQQRAALTTLVSGVRRTQPGATIRLATSALDLFGLARELRRAVARGVHVRFVKVGPHPTAAEQRLRTAITGARDARSWSRLCDGSCRETWIAGGLRALLLVNDPASARRTRYDVNRSLEQHLVDQTSRILVSTGEIALADGQRRFSALS